MLKLKKAPRLHADDVIAAVSLGWGGAGDQEYHWRYQVGKKYIENALGLRVVEMPHALNGIQALYRHPEHRAADLNQAFGDPSIKGIFVIADGDDIIRLQPYLDTDAIRENPKVFMGYSDSTFIHMICLQAGFSSLYGPMIMSEFGENGGLLSYSAHWVKKALFDPSALGEVPTASGWVCDYLGWEEENRYKPRKMATNTGYQLLQGSGVVRGTLIGGSLEVLDWMRGTSVWPDLGDFDDCILFLETSELLLPTPEQLTYWLRYYAASGILPHVSGILWAKPYREIYDAEYREQIVRVLCEEFGMHDLPVLYNASFGHNQPMCCLPYGALAEIDCKSRSFRILEGAVE